jgi:hypothetical protein
VAAWVEFAFLRRALNQRIGTTGVRSVVLAKLWASAVAAAGAAWLLRGTWDLLVIAAFGAVYLAAASALQVSEGVFDFLLGLRRRHG